MSMLKRSGGVVSRLRKSEGWSGGVWTEEV